MATIVTYIGLFLSLAFVNANFVPIEPMPNNLGWQNGSEHLVTVYTNLTVHDQLFNTTQDGDSYDRTRQERSGIFNFSRQVPVDDDQELPYSPTRRERSVYTLFNISHHQQQTEGLLNSWYNLTRRERDLESEQNQTDNSYNLTRREREAEHNLTRTEREAEHNLTRTERSQDDAVNVTRRERHLHSEQNETGRALDDSFNVTRQERYLQSEQNKTDRALDDFFNVTRRERDLESEQNQTDNSYNLTRREREAEHNLTRTERSQDDAVNVTRRERYLHSEQNETGRALDDSFNVTRQERYLQSEQNKTDRALDDFFNVTRRERDLESEQNQTDNSYNLTRREREAEHNLTRTERSQDDAVNVTRRERHLHSEQNETGRALDDSFNVTRQERYLQSEQNKTDRALDDFFNVTRRERDLESNKTQTDRFLFDFFNVTRRERDSEHNMTQTYRAIDDFFNATRIERDAEDNMTQTYSSLNDAFNVPRRKRGLFDRLLPNFGFIQRMNRSINAFLNTACQERDAQSHHPDQFLNAVLSVIRLERDAENNLVETDSSLNDFFNVTRREQVLDGYKTQTDKILFDSFDRIHEPIHRFIDTFLILACRKLHFKKYHPNRLQDDVFNVELRIERDAEHNHTETGRSIDDFFNATRRERDLESVPNYYLTGLEDATAPANNFTRSERSVFYNLFNISRQDYNSKLHSNFNNLNRQERDAEYNETSQDKFFRQDRDEDIEVNSTSQQRIVDFDMDLDETQERHFNRLFNFSRRQPVKNLFESWVNLTKRGRCAENKNHTPIYSYLSDHFNLTEVDRLKRSTDLLNESYHGHSKIYNKIFFDRLQFGKRVMGILKNWFNFSRSERDVDNDETQIYPSHHDFFNLSHVERDEESAYNTIHDRSLHDLTHKLLTDEQNDSSYNLSRYARDVDNDETQIYPSHHDFFNLSRVERDEKSAYNAIQDRTIHNLFNMTHKLLIDEQKDSSYNLSRYARDIDYNTNMTSEFSHYFHSHELGEVKTGTPDVPVAPTAGYAPASNFLHLKDFSVSSTSFNHSETDKQKPYPERI